MWVFGYGSLMCDDWQTEFGCLRCCVADLPGYTRKLNKASVERWGTKQNPGPTLNLCASEGGNCRGMAFEFSADREAGVIARLRKREGGFDLTSVQVRLEDGTNVSAITPMYQGKNLIKGVSDEALVEMIKTAKGTEGSGVKYVRDQVQTLRKLNVVDEELEAIAKQL